MIDHFPAKADPEQVKSANEENEWLEALDPETGEPPKVRNKLRSKPSLIKESSRQKSALKRG